MTEINQLSQTQKQKISMSKHAGSGAVIATFIAAIWVIGYLTAMTYGFGGYGENSLMDLVTGQDFNVEVGISIEALFVTITRFLLAFGFSWLPATLLIAYISGKREDEQSIVNTSEQAQ
ncbi:MAG: hypothetical protein WHV66_11980 [Anaerolineales bacterium]